ncbi:unnamed protein product, partial [marine sediment metagenome]
DRIGCERAARSHLGDIATDWRVCMGADDVSPVVEDEKDRREIAHKCQWQRRYHAARTAGLGDDDARYAVGGFTNHMTVPMPEGFDPQAIA